MFSKSFIRLPNIGGLSYWMCAMSIAICSFCGEEAQLDVLEYFPDERAFILDACCEAMQNQALSMLPLLSRKELCAWFEASTGVRIRQIITADTDNWCVDEGLTLCSVTWQEAKSFIAAHHRHNVVPQGWKFGKGLLSGVEPVGVVTAGNPVAPNLNPKVWLEVTRVCIKDLHPHALGWNGCSQLYGHYLKQARKMGYKHVISYTHLHESGTSLLAAGFSEAGITAGGSWHRANRPRPNAPSSSKKRRWTVDLYNRGVITPRQLSLYAA